MTTGDISEIAPRPGFIGNSRIWEQPRNLWDLITRNKPGTFFLRKGISDFFEQPWLNIKIRVINYCLDASWVCVYFSPCRLPNGHGRRISFGPGIYLSNPARFSSALRNRFFVLVFFPNNICYLKTLSSIWNKSKNYLIFKRWRIKFIELNLKKICLMATLKSPTCGRVKIPQWQNNKSYSILSKSAIFSFSSLIFLKSDIFYGKCHIKFLNSIEFSICCLLLF